jgi:hypothetical protein
MSDDTEVVQPEDAADKPQDPPKGKATGKASRGKSPLDVDYKYTSSVLDGAIGDLDTYEAHRAAVVDDQLSFIEEVVNPMEKRLEQTVFLWMKDPSKNPYAGAKLKIPANLSTVSLAELQERQGILLNAYWMYTELRSVVSAVAQSRANLLERRKHHALVNEGTNEQERKGLSYLRADPEMLMYNKIMAAKEWVDPRYFSLGKMVDAINDAIKTKSIEVSREEKDKRDEYNQS